MTTTDDDDDDHDNDDDDNDDDNDDDDDCFYNGYGSYKPLLTLNISILIAFLLIIKL